MLKISYTLSLGQLLKITFKLKKNLLQKLKPKKTKNFNKVTTNKQAGSSIREVGTIVVVVNNHLEIIQMQIRKNTIEDVLLDGGSGITIITKQLRLKLGLPKPKRTPKLVGLIRDLKVLYFRIVWQILVIPCCWGDHG